MAVFVQKLAIRLQILVRGYAEPAPVRTELAVFPVEIIEERLDHFRFGVVRTGWSVYVSHDLINRFEVPSSVVVTLYLIRVVTASEKLGGVGRSIPEGCFDKFGGLPFADRIADRIIDTRVEDNNNREAMRVGGGSTPVLFLCLLVKQLGHPAVHCPV